MELLIDTNVYLEHFLERDNALVALQFFEYCYKLKAKTYVTSMSLRDIGYVAHHHFHNEKQARFIQFSVYESCHKIIGINPDDAINSLFNDSKDYEDSLIIEAAKREMLDAIVTLNKKDFVNHDIPVFTPSEMVEMMKKLKI